MKDIKENVIVKCPKQLNPDELQDFYEEILTIAKLNHENIVKCYGWYRQPPHDIPHMICEFMDCGDLGEVIKRFNF